MTLAYDKCRCHNIECHLHDSCARWIDRERVEPNHTPHDLFAPEGEECEMRIAPGSGMRITDWLI